MSDMLVFLTMMNKNEGSVSISRTSIAFMVSENQSHTSSLLVSGLQKILQSLRTPPLNPLDPMDIDG